MLKEFYPETRMMRCTGSLALQYFIFHFKKHLKGKLKL